MISAAILLMAAWMFLALLDVFEMSKKLKLKPLEIASNCLVLIGVPYSAFTLLYLGMAR